jgi:hypothetical protein
MSIPPRAEARGFHDIKYWEPRDEFNYG